MRQALKADGAMAQDSSVSMRIDMEGLDRLWQQRIRDRCHRLSLCVKCMHSTTGHDPSTGRARLTQGRHAGYPCNTSQGLRTGET